MKYKIKKILPETQNPEVVVSFSLSLHDWCELEKSVQWEGLEKIVAHLQKRHTP